MRSDSVKRGVQQAPHRSLFNALWVYAGGAGASADRNYVSSYNEIVPGHMNRIKS